MPDHKHKCNPNQAGRRKANDPENIRARSIGTKEKRNFNGF